METNWKCTVGQCDSVFALLTQTNTKTDAKEEFVVLVGHGFVCFFRLCSPFTRSLQTAHAIASRIGKQVKIENSLCEFLGANWYDRDPLIDVPHSEMLQMVSYSFSPTYFRTGQNSFPTLCPFVNKPQLQIDPNYKSLHTPSFPEPKSNLATRYCIALSLIIPQHCFAFPTIRTIILCGHGFASPHITKALIPGFRAKSVGYTGLTELVRNEGAEEWCVIREGDRSHLQAGFGG
jgi:hypothetical protein